MLEIILQILWIGLALWFIYRAYRANRQMGSFSLRSHLKGHDVSKGLDAMFIAGGFVVGLVMIVLLINKLSTCGVVCWS